MDEKKDIVLEEMRTPKALYRKWRPYYFSDSHVERVMGRDRFEYYISQLSSKMQQDEFEEFTRRLIIRRITPNIIPQSGPAGGGDAKVDLETYPVDDSISSKWYVEGGGCRGDEKWAFAISCKAKWEDKIKHDIENAISTQKGYTKFYFFTNQRVKASKRLKIQQDYKKKYQIETVICDLNWYIEAVFDLDCYQIAIDTLHLDKELSEKRIDGPRDVRRNEELNVLQEKIDSHKPHKGIDAEYVNKLLRVAILSRELEKPKDIIEGRFAVALSEAQRYGLKQQIFNIIYQKGWTEYFWFENPKGLYESYEALKAMFDEEINPSRVELLFNLYTLLKTSMHIGLFETSATSVEKERTYWDNLCDRLKDDESHKVSSLYIRILRCEERLMEAVHAQEEDIDSHIRALIELINEASKTIDIPISSLSETIEMIGQSIRNNAQFERLVDTIADIQLKKEGDIAYSNTHYMRGLQNLDNEEYVSAIRNLGSAVVGYQNASTKDYLISTCGLLGEAFSNVDLPNTSILFYTKALSLLFHNASTDGELDHLAITIHQQLCMLALRTGQLNLFLNLFRQLDGLAVAMPQYADETFLQQRTIMDFVLATIFVKQSVSQMPEKLPSLLKRVNMYSSSNVLLYQYGQEEALDVEFKKLIEEEPDWKAKLCARIPHDYLLYPLQEEESGRVKLTTLIKGCSIHVMCDSTIQSTSFARLLIAAIESFLSTAERGDIFVAYPEVNVTIVSAKGTKPEIKPDPSYSGYEIRIDLANETEKNVYETVMQFLGYFLNNNARHKDIISYFDRKEKEEKLGERLAIMASHATEFQNCVMNGYIDSVDEWFTEEDKAYANLNRAQSQSEEARVGVQAQERITDLINLTQWDNAHWKGCGYMVTYDNSEPPLIILLYEDIEYGKRIFEKWERDFNEGKFALRILYVTGVEVQHPSWYRVMITPDLDEKSFREGMTERFVVSTSRIHTMQPDNSQNLDMFKKAFATFGYAGITAAKVVNGNQMTTNPAQRYGKIIPIRSIEFREAWTIGDKDLDMAAILADDHPIIPADRRADAPVLKLLEKRRERAKSEKNIGNKF